MYEMIQFGMYLTGNDEKTVVQLYEDWIKFKPSKHKQKISDINLLNKARQQNEITDKTFS